MQISPILVAIHHGNRGPAVTALTVEKSAGYHLCE